MRVLFFTVAALALSACGAVGSGSPPIPSPSRAAVPAAHVATLISSRTIGHLGDVLVDATGQTLYANKAETATSNACDTECQRTWPLLLAPATGLPRVSGGTDEGLLAMVMIGGTRAVTYAGHPLHEYVGDPAVGDAFGQGIQSVWACVTVSGAAATGSP
jgi:predicted lipoprotein with Yx(FWY)xxD motif